MKGKKLNINKTVVTFDLETTGLNAQTDRIVEIAVIVKHGDKRKKDFIKSRLINPGRPIPEETTAIHGITDEKVRDQPTFHDVAESLADIVRGNVIVGFNSNRFDVPFLLAEFERAGIYDAFEGCQFIDVFRLYKKFNPRTLANAYSEYCGKSLDAHKAENDALATFEVLEAMVSEHDDEIEDNTLDGLSNLTSDNKNVDILGVIVEGPKGPVFNVGKHKGQLVAECRSYCDWLVNKSNFSEDTKKHVVRILKG